MVATGLLCGITVIPAYAGIFASLSEKIRSIVVRDEVSAPTIASPSITTLKPVVVEDGAEARQSQIEDEVATDTLVANVGSMRLSTEDIDFPLDDTISVYEVKKGDTISTVAKLFNVSSNTIIWANDLKSTNLTPGDTLVILPITGIKHTVKKGDTLNSVAKKYKADIEDISKYNGISSDTALAIGDIILVPEGELTLTSLSTSNTVRNPSIRKLTTTPLGYFVRPLVGGIKTQSIHGHNGVDIAARIGTQVVSAAAGKVIVSRGSGYNGGYGKMIVVLHDNGVQTLYAHLNDVSVSAGQSVAQGQVIGSVGNSGRSTGPHLHVEVRGAKNPF